MSKKVSLSQTDPRDLRFEPLNVLWGGPILVDRKAKFRRIQERHKQQIVENARILAEAQAQAQAEILAQAQAQVQTHPQVQEQAELQPPAQEKPYPVPQPVTVAGVPVPPSPTKVVIQTRSSSDDLDVRMVELKIEEPNSLGTLGSKNTKEVLVYTTETAEAKEPPQEDVAGTKQKSKKKAKIYYIEDRDTSPESPRFSHCTRLQADSDSDIELEIYKLAQQLHRKRTKNHQQDTSRKSSSQESRKSSLKSHRTDSSGNQHRRLEFVTDVSDAEGVREIRLHSTTKREDDNGKEEEKKREAVEVTVDAATAGENRDMEADKNWATGNAIPLVPVDSIASTQMGCGGLVANDHGDDAKTYAMKQAAILAGVLDVDVPQSRFGGITFRQQYNKAFPPELQCFPPSPPSPKTNIQKDQRQHTHGNGHTDPTSLPPLPLACAYYHPFPPYFVPQSPNQVRHTHHHEHRHLNDWRNSHSEAHREYTHISHAAPLPPSRDVYSRSNSSGMWDNHNQKRSLPHFSKNRNSSSSDSSDDKPSPACYDPLCPCHKGYTGGFQDSAINTPIPKASDIDNWATHANGHGKHHSNTKKSGDKHNSQKRRRPKEKHAKHARHGSHNRHVSGHEWDDTGNTWKHNGTDRSANDGWGGIWSDQGANQWGGDNADEWGVDGGNNNTSSRKSSRGNNRSDVGTGDNWGMGWGVLDNDAAAKEVTIPHDKQKNDDISWGLGGNTSGADDWEPTVETGGNNMAQMPNPGYIPGSWPKVKW